MNAIAHREAIGRRFGSRIASRDAVFLAEGGSISGLPCTGAEEVRPFGGVNRFMLLQVMKDQSWRDPRFFTAAQVQQAGWKIKPNARKIGLQYFVGTGTDGLPLEEPEVKRFNVFNASDIVGVPEVAHPVRIGSSCLEEAVQRTGVEASTGGELGARVQAWLSSMQAPDVVGAAGAAMRVMLAQSLLHFETGVGAAVFGNDVVAEWASAIDADPLLFFRAVKDAELLAARVMSEVNIVAAERCAEAEVEMAGRLQTDTSVESETGAGMGRQAGTTARVEALFMEREAVLAVPYVDKDRAGKLGAVWYPPQSLWFVPKGLDVALFNEWNPRRNVLGPVATREVLLESFRDAMHDVGIVPPDEILPDGKWHGVAVTCAKNPKNSKGTYILTLDGARDGGAIGTVINKSSGARATWRYEGALLTPEQRAKMRAEVLAREALAAAAALKVQDLAAEHAAEIWAVAGDANGNGYARKKGISTDGLKQVEGAVLLKYAEFKSEAGTSIIRPRELYLLVPMLTADGVLRAVQAISADGKVKSFMRGGQKKGTMFFLGMNSFADVDPAVVSTVAYVEGLSTGDSLHQAVKSPVVVCFDAGNLETVVAETSERLTPAVTRMLAVDNDQFHVERALAFLSDKLGVNPHSGGVASVQVSSGGGVMREVPLGDAIADGEWHQTARGKYSMTLVCEEDSAAVRSVAIEVVPEKARQIGATFANRGVEAGRAAVLAIEALDKRAARGLGAATPVAITMPVFQSLAGRPTDWNDLAAKEGHQAVRAAVGLGQGAAVRRAADVEHSPAPARSAGISR